MNHLVNPLSFRLGIVKFWNSTWTSLSKKDYYSNVLQDLNVVKLFDWFFNFMLSKYGFIFSHCKILKSFGNLHQFLIFFYHSFSEKLWVSYYRIFSSFFFKRFSKSLLKKFFFKNSLNFIKHINFRSKKKNIFLMHFSNFLKKKKKKTFLKKNMKKAWFFLLFCFFTYNFSKNYISLNVIYPFLKSIFFHKFISLKKKIFTYYFSKRANISPFLYFRFYQIIGGNLTASVVGNYLSTKLRQKFKLFKVIDPLLKTLSKVEILDGFKISCSGRFTRKQIATYYWEKRSSLPLNSATRFIDYHYSAITLKNSICGIKVWLCHSSKLVRIKELSKNSTHLNSFYE